MANKKGEDAQENKSKATDRVVRAAGKSFVRKPKSGETRRGNAVQGGKSQAHKELPAPIRIFVRKPRAAAQAPKPPKKRRIF